MNTLIPTALVLGFFYALGLALDVDLSALTAVVAR